MIVARIAILSVLVLAPVVSVATWIASADSRLTDATASPPAGPAAAVAAAANESYCTPELKRILRRVLLSCGLMGADTRGCQPVQARNVATVSGEDFNALFLPMKARAGIVQFDKGAADLDDADVALIDRVFSDRGGASWFFVVSRASPEGSVEVNRALSKRRAEAVMAHLRDKYQDPDLEREVGLLWLGEEFAQLDDQFCAWSRSAEACQTEEINRSAFVAWLDCRL
jgi:outer membrane protein OmpA-like peptidoglycan-associated protein